MTTWTSEELMAWQPPPGWHELDGDQRRAHLDQRGIQLPLRPADWEILDHDQRMTYLTWYARILGDTPEARAAKEREYRKELRAWRVLMCWWIFCLFVGLGLVWGTSALGEGTGLRVGITVFVVAGYAAAIFVPMRLNKPVPHA
ncbi:hypothetical protein [Streptomyces sp. NPDC059611]|uniref:hypothetical protein n=1 Tax=Streptomyces sp. NPDC059611 TaxID=3346884 RepID=UPI0036B970F4